MAELKPCPFCGGEVEIQGGYENWRPTFYDPDSGGDPYFISCKCGCTFSIGSQDPEKFINAWNTRTPIADVVEVETIKAWLYELAINNVGCVINGDFSKACEEIISRIDGLRNFAKERSDG